MNVKKVLCVVAIMLFCGWGGVRILMNIQFSRNCGGYLKRAADSNTIEMATKQLELAVGYMEREHLTSGYTSILWTAPNEDVEFWYNNTKSALEELKKVNPEASQLEKSNVLIKLRETLLDEGQSTSITKPTGISVYPHNAIMALWGTATGIVSIVLLFATGWSKHII